MASFAVALTAPRTVALVDEPLAEIGPADVRIRTLYSGISAGTELAAYRGTSPYLHKRWDAERLTRVWLQVFREPRGGRPQQIPVRLPQLFDGAARFFLGGTPTRTASSSLARPARASSFDCRTPASRASCLESHGT